MGPDRLKVVDPGPHLVELLRTPFPATCLNLSEIILGQQRSMTGRLRPWPILPRGLPTMGWKRSVIVDGAERAGSRWLRQGVAVQWL